MNRDIENPFVTPSEPIVPTDVPMPPRSPQPGEPQPYPEPIIPTDVPMPPRPSEPNEPDTTPEEPGK